VWIKVCNLHFPNKKAEPFLTLPVDLVEFTLALFELPPEPC